MSIEFPGHHILTRKLQALLARNGIDVHDRSNIISLVSDLTLAKVFGLTAHNGGHAAFQAIAFGLIYLVPVD